MNKKLQKFRKISQGIFMILLLTGLILKVKALFLILILSSFIVGNFFCGWVCPYGAIQDFFGLLGDKIFKKKYKIPQKINKYLRFLKYIIAILVGGKIIDKVFFNIVNSRGVFMDVGGDITNITISLSFIIMISFIVMSTVFERPFCNYLCVDSIKFGIPSLVRIFSIKRNEKSCVNCKKCDKSCPMNIEISSKSKVRNAQCINCFNCITTCPIDHTLTYGKIGIKSQNKNKKN